MSRLFLSHSSKNNAEAVVLRDWLAENGWKDVYLDIDPERGTLGGERWRSALYKAAHRCEAVILLISRDWLASEWCLKELEIARRLNKRLLGVLIEDLPLSALPAELADEWQVVNLAEGRDHLVFDIALPGDEEPVTFSEAGLTRLKAGLNRAGLDPRFFPWPPPGDPERAPWRGMAALEAEDVGVLFGREAPMIEVLDRLRGMAEGAAPRCLVILGASGAGKSSFLRAGLLPRLARDETHFLPLPPLRPERAAISGESAGLLAVLERACAKLRLSRSEIAEAVGEGVEGAAALLERLAAEATRPEGRPPTLVLALDQAEELFNAAGREEAEALLSLLAGLLRRETLRLILLATIRSDAYGSLQGEKLLEGLNQQAFSLPPLPRGQWVQVVEGPAARMAEAGRPLRLDPALTERLLIDVEAGAGRDALPLLAFTLGRLWRDHGGKGALTLADYQRSGGVAGAVDSAVERALARADADPAVPRDRETRLALLRRGLIPWLAGIDPETGAARRLSARLSDIPAEARPLIGHLVEERLLSQEQIWRQGEKGAQIPEGDPVIEPTHEALLRQWGLLRGWLKEDFARLSALEALQRAARDWESNARDPAWLSHRAGRLEDAERLSGRPDLWARLGVADRAYLSECRRIENAAWEERERQLQAVAEAERGRADAERGRADEERRRAEAERARRRWAAMGGGVAAALAVVAGIAGIYGFRQAEEAGRQAQIARKQEQAAIAEAGRADAEAENARRAAAEALENETVALAGLSRAAAAEGNFRDALKLALAAWPREGDAERPMLQRTLNALSLALPQMRRNPVTIRHEAGIRSVAFSPDGHLLATASSDKTARLWDAATGAPLGEPMRHENWVSSAAFSPDGRLLATASFDRTARLWDAATGAPLGEPMRHWSTVVFAAFSPDGRLLATASWDKTARLWDAATGAPVGEPMRHEREVYSAAFSPDGRLLATASRDGTARLWDVAGGAPVGEPMRHENSVWSVAFSPDGRLLATASDDGTARLWDAATGAPVGEPMRHEDGVFSAAFSPDGRLLATASFDKTARLWDAATGAPVGEPMRHEDGVFSAAFSPDGRRLATASFDKTARLWDAATGAPIGKSIRHEDGVFSAAFSPDGRLLATASEDRTVRLWDAATGAPIGKPMGHDERFASVGFSPDGRLLAAVSGDGAARLWDAATGAPRGEPMRHEGSVKFVVFSPDGRLLATASGDGTARLWDAATGGPLGEPMRHEGVFFAMFSPDGRLLATLSDDGATRLWDAATGAPRGEPIRHEGAVWSAEFSPDGRLLATASYDGAARLWDAATGAPVGEPMRHEDSVTSVAFSPDGRLLATASSDSTARLRDAASGAPLGEPMRHEGVVWFAAFSPDGRLLATASDDGTARLWDAATGTPLGEPMRHEGEVRAAGFSPDGRLLATVSRDGTVRLWDAATGAPVGEPTRHEGWVVSSATFSPDGRLLATTSDDGTARLWDAASGVAIAASIRHEGDFGSATFSPDGGLLLTTTSGDAARLWDFSGLEPGSVWEIACARLGNDAGLEDVEERYGLSGLVPICGENAPSPFDRTRLR